MANRYVPFGYEISDARVQIIENEAEIVRSIFSLYVQGLSLKAISDRLNLLPVSYADDGRAWNKNMVKRIIENPKYAGDKDYPVIIPPSTAKIALECKQKRYTPLDEPIQKRKKVYHDKARCAICGSKMIVRHSGQKVYWKCADANCDGHRHVLNENKFNKVIAEFLNDIAADLNIIETNIESGMEKDMALMNTVSELEYAMDNPESDSAEVIGKMLELASMRFDRCRSGDTTAVTEKIKEYMALYTPKPLPDGDIIDKIIREIRISPDKTIVIELINNKKFDRKGV